MNKIILCEGMTDAVLLSYYLGKAAGWNYCRKPPSNIAIKEDKRNESINWYEKGNDRLLICSVGGKDNMSPFFQRKILRTIVDAGAFSRMAVILDRDDKEIESIEAHVSSIFKPIITSMVNNQWTENHYIDSFEAQAALETLLVVIPTEHQGALETLMLDSISEDPYDEVIVKKAGQFVKEMKAIAPRYIKNGRDELKAHLGVTWAVQYPEKIFRLIDEQIRNVEWEKSDILNRCFQELIDI